MPTAALDPAPQILLLLDLSLDNPLPEDEVLALLPPSADRLVLRASEFGAQATTRGQQWSRWRSWTLAVDAMLAEAQAKVEPGLSPHYYVAGRASLPLFAYVGLRRGRLGELTVLNQRGSDWDIISTTPRPGPGGRPVFDDPRVLPGVSPEGLVAVFVSTGYPAPEAAMEAYFERNGEKLAATVVLETLPGRRWLDADVAPDAASQVQALMFDLRRYAPKARGAALFLAGPAPLAAMAGRFLNPHMFRRRAARVRGDDGKQEWQGQQHRAEHAASIAPAAPRARAAADSTRRVTPARPTCRPP